jgi:hypothetical protein
MHLQINQTHGHDFTFATAHKCFYFSSVEDFTKQLIPKKQLREMESIKILIKFRRLKVKNKTNKGINAYAFPFFQND